MGDDLDFIWRALSSAYRRRMLDLLRNGSKTTGEIVDAFPKLSRFAVMQHLDVLEEANLILVRKEGRWRFNYLNAVPIRQIYERWVSAFAAAPAESALALKRYAEEETLRVESQQSVKIEMEQTINAPPEKLFEAITTKLDEWFPHRFKPNGKVVVEPYVGGRIYEDWESGQALYGIIQYFDPPFKIGSLGPGGMTTAFSMMSWESFEALDQQRSLHKKTLYIWGDLPPEVEQMFQNGVRSIADAFKSYLEEGKTRHGA